MSSLPAHLQLIQQQLQRRNPASQAVAYYAPQWTATLRGDEDVAYIVQHYPDALTRGDVAELARVAQAQGGDFGAVRRVFLATMMWSYGRGETGPHRTALMLDDPEAERVLPVSFGLVLAGQMIAAYEMFHINRCGPAHFTKYFYFIGLGHQLRPCPLILDAVVASALDELPAIDITPFATVRRNWKDRIVAVGRDPEGYRSYVDTLYSWANTLGCRPDAIEYYLSSRDVQLAVGAEILKPIYESETDGADDDYN